MPQRGHAPSSAIASEDIKSEDYPISSAAGDNTLPALDAIEVPVALARLDRN